MSGTGLMSPPMQYKYLQVIFIVAALTLVAASSYHKSFSYPIILNFINWYHIVALMCIAGFAIVYKRFRI